MRINNPWAMAPVFFKPRTLSTMEDVLRLSGKGYPEGTVVVAGYQKEGRGRFPKRVWISSPGENLMFTLLLRRLPCIPLQRLPVLMGLALSLALEEIFKIQTEVKWPNDLLYQEKKLAGILCEAHTQAILVGLGLNCNQEHFPAELALSACSLKQILGRKVDSFLILERILASIKKSIGDSGWKDKLLRRLYGLGERIVVVQGRELRGVLKGLAEDGALIIQPDNGANMLNIVSGEIRKS